MFDSVLNVPLRFSYWKLSFAIELQQSKPFQPNNKDWNNFITGVVLTLFRLPCFVLRSSRPEVLCDKGVLRNFAKFTGKRLCQSLFFNKVAGLRSATLLKKRFRHRCFPVNFTKFLRATFLQNTSGRMPLEDVHLLKIPRNYLWRS